MARIDLAGKTVFVTGAGSGIGEATARALVRAGANVALVGNLAAPLERLAAEFGQKAIAIEADVTNLVAMEAAVQETLDRFGSLDVCFANAGIAAASPVTIETTTVEEFEQIIEVDLLGVWRTVRACLPAVVEAKGHFLLTGSIYSFFNGMVNAPYAVSKAGVEAFGRSLRGELAGTGATAGVLYPGWTDTAIIRPSHDNAITAELLSIGSPGVLGKAISPETVAAAAVAGMERRSPRVIAPKWWVPISMARGIVNIAMDAVVDRHTRIHHLLREVGRTSEVTRRLR